MKYELFYWDGLPGRGEFIRLAFEEAATAYTEIARGPGGMSAMMALLEGDALEIPPFAPPFLRHGRIVVSQVANILHYVGPKLNLAPEQEGLRITANGLQMTIADMVAEVHDTHHPLASGQYYEDQKDAARLRAADFRKVRMPKYLGYFEKVLKRNPHGAAQIVGDRLSYVDLSLFQLLEGLRYAFPRATKKLPHHYPALCALADAVRERPNIADYLASGRRLAFNESGIFRHYPELDGTAH